MITAGSPWKSRLPTTQLIERYSHNLKHMLVDLRSIGRRHASDCDWELGVHGTRCQNRDPAGPSVPFDHKQRLPVGGCRSASRSIWDAHATDHWSGQQFRRKLSAYGTLPYLLASSLPKGQVMMWQASQKACKPCCITIHRCWRLGQWGSSIFRLWERAPTSPNTTSPIWRSAAQSWEALHYANELFPATQHHLVLLRQQRRECREDAAGIAERFRLFSELTRDRLPDTDIFFGAINRSPEKKER